MNNDLLSRRDLAVLWHPCTQMKDHESWPPIPIKRGQGVWLEDFDGNRYIDAISSWWVNLFGHANPRIARAISNQAQTLEHVLLAGFTHEPIIELSERLVALAPTGLTRCNYADNGSAAVEIALKMSYQFWRNTGNPKKKKFISLSNSYHGETLGALSVGQVKLYKSIYDSLLLDVIEVPSPDCFNRAPEESCRDYSERMFESMTEALEEHADEVCAVIIEPLVQCAGSMRMYDAVYLKLLRAACDQYNVHLIADEVAVGFGRTGTLFACEQAGITPDMLCLGKGITGGFLPLSVCLTTDKIYQAFYDDYETLKAFLHSHSYTGNALACAAALTTLDIFAEDNVIEKNKKLAKNIYDQVAQLQDHPHVAEIRQTGMILAIELIKDKQKKIPYPWQQRLGQKVYQYGLKQGVLLRPLDSVVYLMPPYVINDDEIKKMTNTAITGIHAACQND